MSHYKLKSLVLTLWLLCCAFIALSPSASHALSIDARALEQRLSAANLFGFTNTEVANLQRFYKARQHQPIWIAPESSRLEMALAFIAAADTEGLNSNDYQLHQLQQLQQQPDPSLQAATELEIRTTHAMLSLTRDLSRGRLTATKADADWHIPQTTFDAASFLQDAIKNDRLQPSLHNLAPQQSSYQLLTQTLARYQKLRDHHTEWVHIPDTPSLKPGTTDAIIALIRQRIAQAYAADGIAEYNVTPSKDPHYDDELVAAIRAFQAQHGLNTDGVIGKNTLRALNIPLDWKIRQLRINMERLRWLPKDLGKRYLLVNTAGFRLTATEQGEPVLSMKIIVGRDYRSTPSFNGALSHMVLNPYWNVPDSIARKDLLPKQQSDPSHFTSINMKIFPNHDRNAEAIDPDTIDWRSIKHRFPYVLRQDPGKSNALGRIKFMFSNSFNIYLHDTPSKSLFSKDIRTFSSGCIRLEKPMELAAFSLGEQNLSDTFLENLDSGKTMTVHLRKPLPIYLVYITAWVDEQEKVHFSPDIYGRDLRALHYAGW